MYRLAKGGWPWIVGALTITTLVHATNPWGFMYFSWICWIRLSPFLLSTLYIIYFFRDPHRTPHSEFNPHRSVLSPADGSLCAVEEEQGDVTLYIEMHLTNVHVCRSHVAGTVKSVVRAKGKHYPIYFFKKRIGAESQAIRKNARVIIDIEDAHGHIVNYNLICGKMARRAKPYVRVGDHVEVGQRIGVIAFGSLVKVSLPGTDYHIKAKIADKVKGGKTILAERRLD